MFVSDFLTVLGLAGLSVNLFLLIWKLGERTGLWDLTGFKFFSGLHDFLDGFGVELAFLAGFFGSFLSLLLSNFVGWKPCRLCWFQRVFLYSATVVLGTGLFLNRSDVRDYVFPLVLFGLGFSVYQYLLQMLGFLSSSGCSVSGVSCGETYMAGLGFVTIPLLSFTGFLFIFLVLWFFEG